MKAAQFWTAKNVESFRGFNVTNGEIDLSYAEYREYLNEIYGEVSVCGQTFGQGDLLEDADPCAFRCGMGDYEDSLQSELEEQLHNEDDTCIVFIEDLEEDEEDEE